MKKNYLLLSALQMALLAGPVTAQTLCISQSQNDDAISLDESVGQSFTINSCGAYLHSFALSKSATTSHTGTAEIFTGESISAGNLKYSQSNVTLSGSGQQTVTFSGGTGTLNVSDAQYTFRFSGYDGGSFDIMDKFASSYSGGHELGDDFFDVNYDLNFRVFTTSSDPLPVELLSFKAWKARSGVSLSWSTASELNNKGFIIERTQNGTAWTDVGFIAGNGTSSIIRSYSFSDPSPLKGMNYYRLKQQDYDGLIKYSPVQAVQIDKLMNPLNLYPNPATEEVYIQTEEAGLVHIMDLTGRISFKRRNAGRKTIPGPAEPGKRTVPADFRITWS